MNNKDNNKQLYIMPAEWSAHRATLLAWPHNKADWPGKFAPIPWVYVEIIRNLARYERVFLLVRNQQEEDFATDLLERGGADLDKIDFFHIATNRIWMRDCGPISVGKETVLDFKFNAWAKYPNHLLDDKVPQKLAAELSLKRVMPLHKGQRVVLEGGAIDVNGKGALLTTEECLLSAVQCRNPGFSAGDYEEVFARYLGISKTIWLQNGIVGDDTHGHVDDLARFVNENTVAIVTENNRHDENYSLLKENLKRLKKTSLNIIELPMPKPVVFEGTRLPASYANFYIANRQVIVPTFNDVNDRIALNLLSEAFPKHEIIGIYCGDFIWGLGTLHCLSQQVPL